MPAPLLMYILLPAMSLRTQGNLGPFRAGVAVNVPLWVAIRLKEDNVCHITCPPWMTVGACCCAHAFSIDRARYGRRSKHPLARLLNSLCLASRCDTETILCITMCAVVRGETINLSLRLAYCCRFVDRVAAETLMDTLSSSFFMLTWSS